jgi:hypothetical protein
MKTKYFTTSMFACFSHAALIQQQVDQFSMPTPYDLAQVESANLVTNENRCHFAHDRVKNASDIFYGVNSGSSEYIDATFPHDYAIRWNDHQSHQGNLAHHTDAIWADSIDLAFPEEDGYSLWGDNGISPHDIFQGEIGNCWFMNSASVLAEKPGRLENVFLNDELSKNGIYGCNMYVMGVPTTITVDDSIPLGSDNG